VANLSALLRRDGRIGVFGVFGVFGVTTNIQSGVGFSLEVYKFPRPTTLRPRE
jgi:hypothetical protein